jgi:lysyl-tRNA synthetase class 1
VTVLPPEIVRYLILRAPPAKRLYFDPENGVAQLIDEFAALLAKENKTADEQQLVAICNRGIDPTICSLPFTQLVASYQASLKDPAKTLELLERTVRKDILEPEREIIKDELVFIDEWLKSWAPEDIKFELAEQVDASKFDNKQRQALSQLADKIEQASENADGEWFHKAIYDLKDSTGLEPKELFQTLYQALIAKDSGPRAGWFLSILPHDWLIKRLRLKA